MPRKTNAFTSWVGSTWNRWRRETPSPPGVPKSSDPPQLTAQERLDRRYQAMMDEVDRLNNDKLNLEEKGEYTWIVLVRNLLPMVFFTGFGYEDGLFMTGFQYLSWVPFVLLMYAIGYGLEALRVAMVYSMTFSKAEGLKREYVSQLGVWVVMSLGCGVAQLASALVIQALGGDHAIAGTNTVAAGAQVIMARMPFLVYLAIGIRVVLCGVADWTCSSFLHKRKPTAERKIASIEMRASNLQKMIQANINAQTIQDNSRHFQEMIEGERAEIKSLRNDQKKLFDIVYEAGMQQVRRVTEVTGPGQPPFFGSREEE